jgi:hypothetical protein
MKSVLYDLTHRTHKRTYDDTHKRERQDRDAKRGLRQLQMTLQEISLGNLPRGGVYLVQLVERHNTIKIGCSRNVLQRLAEVGKVYGRLQYLLTLPHEKPRVLEHTLHEFFASMRIYDGGSSSELFAFHTRAEQKQLEALCRQFPIFCKSMPLWSTISPQNQPDNAQPQPSLFSPLG